jgi:hypothetical protein
MALERSVSALAHHNSRGENVWAVLCRAALSSIEWAAEACGAKDAAGRIERTELFIEHGPVPLIDPSASPFEEGPLVDWARLGELERAHIARVTGR